MADIGDIGDVGLCVFSVGLDGPLSCAAVDDFLLFTAGVDLGCINAAMKPSLSWTTCAAANQKRWRLCEGNCDVPAVRLRRM